MAKKTTRRQLRGKPLEDFCKTGFQMISTHEFGEEDNRQFCRGKIDLMNDEPFPECVNCGAWVYNAEPILEAST